MKKILVLSFIVIACVVGFVFYKRASNPVSGKVVVGEISERAQEFVDSQRNDPGNSWQSKQLEPTEQLAVKPPSTLQETPCFSIDLPLPIRSVYPREETDCVLMFRLTSPAAKLTISLQPYNGVLSQQADVNMRTVVKDTYQPTKFETSLYSDSTAFTDPQGISFFALKDGQFLAVIFSETNDQEKILAESLPKVLEALMIYQ